MTQLALQLSNPNSSVHFSGHPVAQEASHGQATVKLLLPDRLPLPIAVLPSNENIIPEIRSVGKPLNVTEQSAAEFSPTVCSKLKQAILFIGHFDQL
jgi:hypothetical protein